VNGGFDAPAGEYLDFIPWYREHNILPCMSFAGIDQNPEICQTLSMSCPIFGRTNFNSSPLLNSYSYYYYLFPRPVERRPDK
jgi:hypothetical protein